jgi:hypothetical protein
MKRLEATSNRSRGNEAAFWPRAAGWRNALCTPKLWPEASRRAAGKGEAMIRGSIAESFRRQLQGEINAARLPDGFYETFEFTTTSRNLCHPITMSLIANAVAKLEGVKHAGVDVRFNLGGGVKFQPDVVGFGEALGYDLRHVLYVDFESPNSCDTRIKPKNVLPYRKWARQHHDSAPYVVVTSLPNKSAQSWQLRYTSGQGVMGRNRKHKQYRSIIRESPFR